MGHKILGEGAPHGEGKHFSRGRGGGGGDIVNFIFLKLGGGGVVHSSPFLLKGNPVTRTYIQHVEKHNFFFELMKGT